MRIAVWVSSPMATLLRSNLPAIFKNSMASTLSMLLFVLSIILIRFPSIANFCSKHSTPNRHRSPMTNPSASSPRLWLIMLTSQQRLSVSMLSAQIHITMRFKSSLLMLSLAIRLKADSGLSFLWIVVSLPTICYLANIFDGSTRLSLVPPHVSTCSLSKTASSLEQKTCESRTGFPAYLFIYQESNKKSTSLRCFGFNFEVNVVRTSCLL